MHNNFRGARAVPNPDNKKFIEGLNLKDSLYNNNIESNFITDFTSWISRSNNKIVGLEDYTNVKLCHGSTQAFDHFYLKYHTHRFRTFTGEFMYHRAVFKNRFLHEPLENSSLSGGDAVIISVPFSDYGKVHYATEHVLNECDERRIPVLIDMAYAVCSENIDIDLSHPCIDTVTFSMSKFFHGAENLRVGIRYQRSNSDDGIDVFNSVSMVNRYDVAIAHEIIKNYEPDYCWKTYGEKYYQVIKELDLTPTNCIMFGLSTNKYPEFNRGNETTRICISELLV